MNIHKKNKAAILAAAFCGGLFSISAMASPITGTLQVAGSVNVSSTAIDFILPVGPPDGELDILGNGNTGTFSVFNTGSGVTQARITDLTNGPQTGMLATPVTNFISFAGTGLAGDHFDLTFISPGSDPFPPCTTTDTTAFIGETCTPSGSPFNLQNLNNSGGALASGSLCYVGGVDRCSVAIGIALGGNAINTTGEVSAFTGSLSTQIQNTTFQDVLTQLNSNNGTGIVNSSYSGTFIATAPEPGTTTMLFLGLGMITLGYVRRKHQSSRQ